MIKLDRLKKLIDKKATIWFKTFNSIYSYELKENINNGFYYDTDEECLLLMKEMNNEEDYAQFAWKLEDLFETEADAKWALEFGNIVREEKLVLPSWEEAQKERFCWAKSFDSLYGFRLFMFINKFTNDFEVNCFHGYKTNDYCIEKHFDLRDKEQYIKGCRLCKQLFLGEKV